MSEPARKLSALGEAALAYADRHWYVFPLIPGDKQPLIRDYYTLSSIDPDQIRAWWTQTPFANVGLDCGKTGVVGIDIDPRNGGDKWLPGLKLLTGGTSRWQTWRSITHTGGEHYVFHDSADPELEVKSGAGRFGAEGIDAKGRGGYLVLPPSRTVKGTYRVADDIPPLPIPRALLSRRGVQRDDAGRTALEAMLQDGERIGKGARNQVLHAVTSKLVGLGFGYTETLALMREFYASRVEQSPDFLDDELVDIVRKAANRYAATSLVVTDAIRNATAVEMTGTWNDRDQALAVNASTFLAECEDETVWITQGLLQATSVNMMMGPPKAGKSTLSRRMAVDVAYGLPFLGRFETKQSRVLYYSLQENKSHLKRWLSEALASVPPTVRAKYDDVPIDFVFRLGKRGSSAIDGLRERCESTPYGLIVIDMLGRFAGLRSLDDYAEVEALLDYLKDVVDATGTCVVWLHHERKAGGAFEGGIGSQAIRGAVYSTLKVWKEKGSYFIASEQRDGEDLEPTSIIMDKKTGVMRTGGGRLAVAMTEASQEIARYAQIEKLIESDPTMSANAIFDIVGGVRAHTLGMVKKIKTRPKE